MRIDEMTEPRKYKCQQCRGLGLINLTGETITCIDCNGMGEIYD